MVSAKTMRSAPAWCSSRGQQARAELEGGSGHMILQRLCLIRIRTVIFLLKWRRSGVFWWCNG